MKKCLLGFDVRVSPSQYVRRQWDDISRRRFLLRQDVEWPLSVDEMIWPSVFYDGARPKPPNEFSVIAVEPSAKVTQRWLELEAMRRYYDAYRHLAPGGVFIGIELLSEMASDGEVIAYNIDADRQNGHPLEQTVPMHLPEKSTLLGFDVADAGEISGLSDCAYSDEDVQRLGVVWSTRLNSVGLLSSLDDAVEFRHVSDRRVPEHSPFWIYALWRLPIE